MENTAYALSLENIMYSYKNKFQTTHALKGVSCGFEYGKFYAIIGKSGSGKTTLLSLMADLDAPSDGKILYDGQEIKSLDENVYRRDNVSVIYQSYNLLPLLTVLENVSFPLELKNVPQAEADKVSKENLSAVGLDEKYYKRYPAMLSGGEQQRVAIARALASGAGVILADEPTGNLDTENGNRIVDILQRLAHEKGRCVIVVTHDMSIAERADGVIKLGDGLIQP